MTLRQLAAMLASPRLAELGSAPLSQLAMEALAARVTHELRAKKQLPYFAPVADTPGFARALAATLTELRLHDIDPVRVAATGAPGTDLAELLRLYALHLDRRSLADAAAILNAATEVAVAARHRLAGLPLLLLDVPVRTTLELRFLAAAAVTAPAVLATVPEGDVESLTALSRALAVDHESLEEPVATALDRVRSYLFLPDLPASLNSDETLDVFSAAGEGLECVEIARRLHALAATGLHFDRAAILLRSPERYLPLLEEALRRAGIPAYFSRGTARPDPAGRAFLALLACASDGCSASRFAEYLSLAQVPQLDSAGAPVRLPRHWTRTGDEVLSAFQRDDKAGGAAQPSDDAPSLSAPFGWEQLLVDASVIGGPARWKRRLDGLARELEIQLDEAAGEDDNRRASLDRRLQQLRRLQQYALPLIDRLAALPAEAPWSMWIDDLTALAETALRHPESVLSVLNELRPMSEVGPATLDEVYGVLSDRLSFLRAEPPPRRYGCVWVGSTEEARGRCFDVVFLPGLAEGIFPKRAAEDPLLLDVYRKDLDGLLQQDGRVARERLLLRVAAASARTRLVVSYPRMDTALARPRVPSFYALEVVRAAEGQLPELRTFEKRASSAAPSRLGFPAPTDARQAIDDAEYDLATLWGLLHLPAGEASGRARYLVLANAHLGRSLRARYRRWHKTWSPADGIVDPDAATLKVLQEQRPSQRSYSPTALQHFASCPYRFLLSAILRLEPRDKKVAIEKLDPLTRGALFHEIQFAFFNALRKDGVLPLTPDRLSGALDLADRISMMPSGVMPKSLPPRFPACGVPRSKTFAPISAAGSGRSPKRPPIGFRSISSTGSGLHRTANATPPAAKMKQSSSMAPVFAAPSI